MFFHSGSVTRLSDDERAFMALSISITTRMESEMVEAVRAVSSLKMEHETPAKSMLVRLQE